MDMRELTIRTGQIQCNRTTCLARATADLGQAEFKTLRKIVSAKFASCSGGGDAADTHAMGGIRASVRRGDGALPQAAADGGGGRRAAGHVGAAFPPAARALRGGRR